MPLNHTPEKAKKGNGEDEIPFKGFEDAIAADAKTTTQLNSLFRQRNQTVQKVLRVSRIMNNLEFAVTPAQLKVYQRKLQSAYDEFSTIHNGIMAIIPDDHVLGQEDEYNQFESIHDEASAAVESLIMENEVQRSHQPQPPQVIIHQQPLKAPIPTFDGDYAKWPKFKAMFQDIMGQSRDSDAIKLYHLDKALTDKAAGSIDVKTINEGNYAQAWRILAERYENPRVIVETHIRGLLSLPKMSTESSDELQKLLDRCTNHVESLEYLGQNVTGVSELMIVYLLTSALDTSTRRHWEQKIEPGVLPEYKSTLSFLKSQCQILERCEQVCQPSYPKSSIIKPTIMPKFTSQRSHTATTNEELPFVKCDFCGAPHRNYQCNKLSTLSNAERVEKVRSTGACFNCLQRGHRLRDCPSPKSCRKCNKRHHTQLHEDTEPANDSNIFPSSKQLANVSQPIAEFSSPTMVEESTTNITCSCSYTQGSKTVLLLTAVVRVLDKNRRQHQCRVLLDSGSQVNFVTEKLADTLGLPNQPSNVQIAGINNINTLARNRIELEFQSKHNDYRCKLECLVIPKITGKIPSTTIDVKGWELPQDIQLADPTFFKSNQIDMLIGAELFFSVLKSRTISIDDSQLVLRDSHLGWLVTGTLKHNANIYYSQLATIQSIEESIQRFWQVEEVPIASQTSTEELRCEEHFTSTHYRDSDGRFVVKLPLKENADQIDSCRALALKRFFMLEHRLQKNPQLKAQYVAFIREYQLLGHCRIVSEAEDDSTPLRAHEYSECDTHTFTIFQFNDKRQPKPNKPKQKKEQKQQQQQHQRSKTIPTRSNLFTG
ncbi:uncharacterized protein LOC129766285 [Toxorhynchites rutilus septentrionalis]|uniref:uncharacterized protein LOC129766285 n=1 Tax=Toxorhynchites rutilus septentrionalis TaxID=329112 RepID=UPI00247939E6|nr:uncharacterized protein LOC129766285 [Toxorhynchites rutilus septentrionalis]